jgi:hypothetical protein
MLNSLGHFTGNRVTDPGEDHSYCGPWVDHVHLALIDKMTVRSLQKGRPRGKAGGSHELGDMSPDYPNISEDTVPAARY